LRLAKFVSVTEVRHEFRHVFNEEAAHKNGICHWDRQLKETGSLVDMQHSGRPSVNDKSVDII
jgi:hypothetical protein